MNDPQILAQIISVLGNWNFTGYITAKELVLEWIARELPGLTLKDIAMAMNAHVQAGGVIHQQPETRMEWRHWAFHYDFRLSLAGRDLYIETVLLDDDPRDPTIHIVSLHNA